MRTRTLSWQLALLLAIGGALGPACSDDDKPEDDGPPVLGDGDGDGDGDTGDGDGDGDVGVDAGGGDGDGDGDVGPDAGGDGDGDDAGVPDCVENPTTSVDILNGCPPPGVARLKFDNATRLPSP